MKLQVLISTFLFMSAIHAQNVGIGIATPKAMLHIKGNADTSQLVIDANATQSNSRPLIRLRKADGTDLLHIHSDNINNTFVGLNAGRVNNAVGGGIYNSFFGSNAGYSNSIGNYNTAIGFKTLFSNNSGANNTASGYQALFSNTDVGANTASGYQALFSSNADANTANGFRALYSNNLGVFNTSSGYQALYYNSSGSYNTSNGSQALYNNTTGSSNVATGSQALYYNNGNNNTANGSSALYNNTTGIENTAIGDLALYYNIGGSYNIGIGYNSGTYSGTPNIYNSIGIGNDGILNGTNNQVVIGNFSTDRYYSHVPWGTFSDARIKKDIKEEVKGLDFITRLRPVTYYKSIKAMQTITDSKETKDFPGKYDVEKIKFSGFLAQEVEKAANESGYDFSGLHKPNNSREMYALSYETFVVPLVKAVQEQQAMIEEMKIENRKLKTENEELRTSIHEQNARLQKLEALLLK